MHKRVESKRGAGGREGTRVRVSRPPVSARLGALGLCAISPEWDGARGVSHLPQCASGRLRTSSVLVARHVHLWRRWSLSPRGLPVGSKMKTPTHRKTSRRQVRSKSSAVCLPRALSASRVFCQVWTGLGMVLVSMLHLLTGGSGRAINRRWRWQSLRSLVSLGCGSSAVSGVWSISAGNSLLSITCLIGTCWHGAGVAMSAMWSIVSRLGGALMRIVTSKGARLRSAIRRVGRGISLCTPPSVSSLLPSASGAGGGISVVPPCWGLKTCGRWPKLTSESASGGLGYIDAIQVLKRAGALGLAGSSLVPSSKPFGDGFTTGLSTSAERGAMAGARSDVSIFSGHSENASARRRAFEASNPAALRLPSRIG